ncbi:GntR family transcriptional regulator [Chryseobacterium sp. Ch-15]|uniref:GntR family transcriptional regulator n=1 Tax=Chryseobacterium muglaense TaxID=2893752 RepID=A0A9Q3UV08_9FLAO|nr:GntR family transcriptional regulator [Chryseobacterium muglaense]MBD3903430.1 GntR family transcriptional regulator [Chryseobacterium muglaense]MCC9034503.1 GntR family transcriptional regulator [Chryseobacterium muglaense]MCM2552765.1 GntR family transcriptional regulator [Chryseobacterium muglaense]
MITQQSLKSQIIKALWQLIIDGKIMPNEPMREIQLTEILNISRTPLRDALQQLEWEGIVVSEARKGYRLAPFSEADIDEIYPLRARLESFALELSGVPNKIVLDELYEINLKIQNSKSPREIVELDESWHLLLISNCPNQRLLKLIKTLHRQSQRYEYAYMAMNKTVEKSSNQHENILIQLQNGQLKKAAELLAENNLVGMDTMINWLKSK